MFVKKRKKNILSLQKILYIFTETLEFSFITYSMVYKAFIHHNSLHLTLLVFLTTLTFETPFTQISNPTVFNLNEFDISDDGEVIVLGSYSVNVLKKSQGQYKDFDSLKVYTDFQVCEVSGDGSMILAIGKTNDGFIFKLNETTSEFDVFQEFELPQRKEFSAGALSNDKTFAIIAYSDQVLIYKFNGLNYTILQRLIKVKSQIICVRITSDNAIFAFSTSDYNIYIYKFNGTYFERMQTIFEKGANTAKNTSRKISLTNDHQYLTFVGGDKTFSIYKYNEYTEKFTFFMKKYNQNVNSLVSLSNDKRFVFVSTWSYLQIYSFIGGQLNLLQRIRNSFGSFVITNNDEYLMIGSSYNAKIFQFSCKKGQTYDIKQNKCTSCSDNCALVNGTCSCFTTSSPPPFPQIDLSASIILLVIGIISSWIILILLIVIIVKFAKKKIGNGQELEKAVVIDSQRQMKEEKMAVEPNQMDSQ